MKNIKIKYYYYENIFRTEIKTKILDIENIENMNFNISEIENDHLKLRKRCLFTGIIDKDGNEIFEGDIIEKSIPTSCYDFEKTPSYFEVVYHKPTARFGLAKLQIPMNRNFVMTLDEGSAIYYKVVGNIYEDYDFHLLKTSDTKCEVVKIIKQK